MVKQTKKPSVLEAAIAKFQAAEAALIDAEHELELIKRDLVYGYPQIEGHDLEDLHFGFHACKTSPTQQCVYDIAEDPCRDFCFFCEDPEERK